MEVPAEAYRDGLRDARRRTPADLHLHLGLRYFPAHQFVLRALSARIDNFCKQAVPSAVLALDCTLLDVAPEALDAFLDMAYGGSAPPRQLQGVRQIAEYYQVSVVLDCLPEPSVGGRRGRQKGPKSAAAKAIKREPVDEVQEVKVKKEVKEEACFKRPRRKSAVVRALESSALTGKRRTTPSPRSSPDWGAQVMVRRSPRFCKEGEAVHLRSPPAARKPPPQRPEPRVKAEPRPPEDDDDDTVVTGWPDVQDSQGDGQRDVQSSRSDGQRDVRDSRSDGQRDVQDSRYDAQRDLEGSRDDTARSSSSDDECEIVGERAPSRPRFSLPGRTAPVYAAELSPAQLVPRTPDLRADLLSVCGASPLPLPPPRRALPEGEGAVAPGRRFDFLSLVPSPEDGAGGDPLRSLFYGTERRLLGGQVPADAPWLKRPADAESSEPKRPKPSAVPREGSSARRHLAASSFAAPSPTASRYPTASSCTTDSTIAATASSCSTIAATSTCTTPSTITASSCTTPSTTTVSSCTTLSTIAASSFTTPSTITAASRYPTASNGTLVATSSGTLVATSSGTLVATSSGTLVATSSGTLVATSSGTLAATSRASTPSAINLTRCTVPEPARPGGAAYVKTFIQRLTERDRQTGEVKVQQVSRVSELDVGLREQGRATTALYRSCERPALVCEEEPPQHHVQLRLKGQKTKKRDD